MATYTLIAMAERTGALEGWAAQTGLRTKWSATLSVGRVDTSVTVLLEGSASGNSDSWTELTDFGGAKTAVGTTTETTYAETADFTVSAQTRYLRARVSDATGTYAVEVTVTSAFVDTSNATDKALLSQELRNWQDGLVRTVEDAEAAVCEVLAVNSQGLLGLNLNSTGGYDAIRRAIARQAEWQYGTDKMRQSTEPSAIASLRQRTRLAPGLLDGLTPYRSRASSVWQGR